MHPNPPRFRFEQDLKSEPRARQHPWPGIEVQLTYQLVRGANVASLHS